MYIKKITKFITIRSENSFKWKAFKFVLIFPAACLPIEEPIAINWASRETNVVSFSAKKKLYRDRDKEKSILN